MNEKTIGYVETAPPQLRFLRGEPRIVGVDIAAPDGDRTVRVLVRYEMPSCIGVGNPEARILLLEPLDTAKDGATVEAQ